MLLPAIRQARYSRGSFYFKPTTAQILKNTVDVFLDFEEMEDTLQKETNYEAKPEMRTMITDKQELFRLP